MARSHSSSSQCQPRAGSLAGVTRAPSDPARAPPLRVVCLLPGRPRAPSRAPEPLDERGRVDAVTARAAHARERHTRASKRCARPRALAALRRPSVWRRTAPGHFSRACSGILASADNVDADARQPSMPSPRTARARRKHSSAALARRPMQCATKLKSPVHAGSSSVRPRGGADVSRGGVNGQRRPAAGVYARRAGLTQSLRRDAT
jgi:hypothetical protein